MTTPDRPTLSVEQSMLMAWRHFHAGTREDAAMIGLRVLQIEPKNPDALHLLGILAYQANRQEEAITLLTEAIRGSRKSAPMHGNLALAKLAAGDLNGAAASARRAFVLQPSYADAHRVLGLVYFKKGQLERAIDEFERAQRLGLDTGDLQSHLAQAHNLYGLLLLERGNVHGGHDSIRRSLELNPVQPDMGQKLMALTNSSTVLIRLASVFSELGRDADALSASAKAIQCDDNAPEAHFHHATALRNAARVAESFEHFRRAIELGTNSRHLSAFWHGLGTALACDGQVVQALHAHDAALSANPDNIKVRVDRAMLLLKNGDFGRGWEEYESRHKLPELQTAALRPDVPQWRGEDLRGKSITLISEQGLGDTIQFIRYAPLLARRGARVVVVCEGELKRLLGSIEGVASVSSLEDQGWSADFQCRLLSLPLGFHTTLDSIPAEIPYIKAEPSAAAAWSQRLGVRRGPRIGLAWSGRRRPQPNLYRADLRRSLPLSTCTPLLAINQVEFYSLQKGVSVKECGDFAQTLSIRDHPKESKDFMDDVPLIENLDLVISVDTSVAHLVGAMGRPIWLLSSRDSCWRWLVDRSDSPWYPTMRIFRQPSPGDWDSVISEVKTALERFAADWRTIGQQTRLAKS